LLLVGALSSGAAITKIALRRDPVVSYATRARLLLRAKAAPKRARDAEIAGLKAAWSHPADARRAIEGDGKIEGEPLDRAHSALGALFKPDEAFAFDLWASPRKDPKVLVLYFEASLGQAPIWTAMTKNGEEI